MMIGHMTFISLCRREALYVFGEVFNFIRSYYEVWVPIWPAVRRELQIWDGISPVILKDLDAEWSSVVSSVDASEWGLGACEAIVDIAKVKETGK